MIIKYERREGELDHIEEDGQGSAVIWKRVRNRFNVRRSRFRKNSGSVRCKSVS